LFCCSGDGAAIAGVALEPDLNILDMKNNTTVISINDAIIISTTNTARIYLIRTYLKKQTTKNKWLTMEKY